MSDIVWPDGFVPGFTDNFCSNEEIVRGLSVAQLWPWLNEPGRWPTYYENASNVRFAEGGGPALVLGARFAFETFGLVATCRCVEHVPPVPGQPARLAWHGFAGDGEGRLDAHHAWLLEDLSEGRVRILTQETQNGAPARQLAATRPNPMLEGHQAWLDGLLAAARGLRA
ncbi:MAG: SRPBCC domain-containing protein [Myxococcota bacterium]